MIAGVGINADDERVGVRDHRHASSTFKPWRDDHAAPALWCRICRSGSPMSG